MSSSFKRFFSVFCIAIFLLIGSHIAIQTMSLPVLAQDVPSPSTPDSPNTPAPPVPPSPPSEPVLPDEPDSQPDSNTADKTCRGLQRLELQSFKDEQDNEITPHVRLGDTINVTVTGLTDAIATQSVTVDNLKLYLNGYGLNDIPAKHLGSDQLAYRLSRTDANQEVWESILQGVWNRKREVSVTVGCSGQGRLENPSKVTMTLELWGSLRFLIAGFVPLLFLLLLLGIYRKKALNLIRNPGQGDNRAFSLGRTQLAVWFALILSSFVLIYGITGDYTEVVTPQAVALLGLGGITTLTSALIDRSDSQQAALENKKSKNLITDLITDASGNVNLHRFQMMVWTLVLAGVFLYEVFKHFRMPDFDDTLLILQGISDGIYVTLKTQENQNNAPTTQGGQQ